MFWILTSPNYGSGNMGLPWCVESATRPEVDGDRIVIMAGPAATADEAWEMAAANYPDESE